MKPAALDFTRFSSENLARAQAAGRHVAEIAAERVRRHGIGLAWDVAGNFLVDRASLPELLELVALGVVEPAALEAEIHRRRPPLEVKAPLAAGSWYSIGPDGRRRTVAR